MSAGYVRIDDLNTANGTHDKPTNAQDLVHALRACFRVQTRSTDFNTEAAAAVAAMVADGWDVDALMLACGYSPTP